MMDRDIQKYLPHRPPFVFVDEFETDEKGETTVGNRLFTEDDFFFKGHFPGMPVVPGVILVECLAQCGGAGIVKSGRVPGNSDFFLATVKEAKFHAKVGLGDRLDMEIETLRIARNRFIVQHGKGTVNGELAVEASWVCAVVPKDQSPEA